jgi:hypothetical protein
MPLPFGEFDEPGELLEGCLVRLVGRFHELRHLQVNADDVRPELAHLGEIFLDLRPFGVPVILDQSPLFVVVVIEAPGDESLFRRFENEASFVVRNADAFEFCDARCLRACDERETASGGR